MKSIEKPRFYKKHDLLQLRLWQATLKKIKTINKVAKVLGKKLVEKKDVEAIKQQINKIVKRLYG